MTTLTRTRHTGIDTLRGMAIAAMMVDHVCKLIGPELWPLRWTVGRLALPIFFVLAGYLVRSLSRRHALIGLVGLGLPLAVPWIDSPNVLVWWAIGCGVLVAARTYGVDPAVLVVVCVALLANGIGGGFPHSYPPVALLALMATGAWLRRDWFPVPAVNVPAFAALGRAPVRWYVGHVLVLEMIRLVVS